MIKKILSLIILATVSSTVAFAGNPDRIGEAGATHLLVNPWARSSGWGGANTACVSGLEAMRLNVGGLVRSDHNQIVFTNTDWFSGADIKINSFGVKLKLGESSAFGANVMSFSMGDFQRTTEEFPDGTLGSFSPNFTNIGVSYAYAFSEQTSGGVTVRMISESIADMNATGVAIDAGIQYQSRNERFKLGFSLRNVGPSMQYSGDGVDIRVKEDGNSNATARTMKSRVASFELPTVLNIGVAYVLTNPDSLINHNLTVAGNFMANSFGKDVIAVGLEYSYKDMLFLRGGYAYEEDVMDEELSTNAASGPSFGATFQIPYSGDKTFGVDYSYRDTYNQFTGIHSVGVTLNF